MMQPLTLAQWLSAPRPPQTLIAWQEAHSWTLAHLRYDVAHLLNNLQQQPGERWALCFDNSYRFWSRCWPRCMRGKRQCFLAIAERRYYTNSERFSTAS